MCEAAGLQAAVQAGSSPVQSVPYAIQNPLHAVRQQEHTLGTRVVQYAALSTDG